LWGFRVRERGHVSLVVREHLLSHLSPESEVRQVLPILPDLNDHNIYIDDNVHRNHHDSEYYNLHFQHHNVSDDDDDNHHNDDDDLHTHEHDLHYHLQNHHHHDDHTNEHGDIDHIDDPNDDLLYDHDVGQLETLFHRRKHRLQ